MISLRDESVWANESHNAIKDFTPFLQMTSGVYLTVFGTLSLVRPAFPNQTFLLQIMANDVAKGRYKTSPSRVFNFEEIREAYRVMEANETKGTMVVGRNEN